jgi:hypothetical protein
MTTDDSCYQTFLIDDIRLEKTFIMKSPKAGTYTNYAEYLASVREWNRIGSHPNIAGLHFVDIIGEIPRVVIEYFPFATLESISSWCFMRTS